MRLKTLVSGGLFLCLLIGFLFVPVVAATDVTSCQPLTGNDIYYLQNDVDADYDCFLMNNNMVFDGQGHTIYFNCTAFRGIGQTQNVTIRNVDIKKNGTCVGTSGAFFMDIVENITVENITLSQTVNGAETHFNGIRMCIDYPSGGKCRNLFFKNISMTTNSTSVVLGSNTGPQTVENLTLENIFVETTYEQPGTYSSVLSVWLSNTMNGNLKNIEINSTKDGIGLTNCTDLNVDNVIGHAERYLFFIYEYSNNIIITNVKGNSPGDGFNIINSHDILLDGIEIDGNDCSQGCRGLFSLLSANVTIQDFEIYNTSSGLTMINSDQMTARDGHIYDINRSVWYTDTLHTSNGIVNFGTNHTLIENVVVNATAGPGMVAGGIVGSFGMSHDMTVTNSTFSYGSLSLLPSGQGSPIALLGVDGFVMNDSRVTDSAFSMIISNATPGKSTSYNSNDVLLYNNYFDYWGDKAIGFNATDTNFFLNTTKTPGTNIIGGSYIGGNYWSGYDGCDMAGDGIGDTEIPFNDFSTGGYGNIPPEGDFLPLTDVECTEKLCDSCSSCTQYIQNSNAGDTIKLTADIINYSGETCIDFWGAENNITFDCDGHSIIGDGDDTGYAISLPNNDGETIKNCNISLFLDGIVLYHSANNAITNVNSSYNARYGIEIAGTPPASPDSTIMKEIVLIGNDYGIIISRSGNNTMDDVYISDCGWIKSGIWLEWSDNNTLKNSIIERCPHGITFGGGPSTCNGNLFYNNILNNTDNIQYSDNWYPQTNYLNVTEQAGNNIYNASLGYIGGNLWTNPSGTGFSDTCPDSDSDGFCDSLYNESSGINIAVDYLPLAKAVDQYAEIEPLTVKTIKSTDVPLEGQDVHLYTGANAYVGPNTTDGNGEAAYSDLADDTYKAKTYFQGKWFWSPLISYPAEYLALINITVTDIEVLVYVGETPLEGQAVHCYTDTNVYIGPNTTDSGGRTEWELSDGDYKCKTYYQGQWFWTDVFSVPDNTSVNLTIEQQMFYVSVRAGDNPLENQQVHLYTEANVYVGPQTTNSSGIATYSLTEGNYKAKTYFQGKWFWSEVGNTSLTDTVNITIRLTDVPVYVMDDGIPLENQVVHCYTDANVYIGPETTNEEGRSDWELSDGDYKCKTYHEGEWLWTDTFTVPVILNV